MASLRAMTSSVEVAELPTKPKKPAPTAKHDDLPDVIRRAQSHESMLGDLVGSDAQYKTGSNPDLDKIFRQIAKALNLAGGRKQSRVVRICIMATFEVLRSEGVL